MKNEIPYQSPDQTSQPRTEADAWAELSADLSAARGDWRSVGESGASVGEIATEARVEVKQALAQRGIALKPGQQPTLTRNAATGDALGVTVWGPRLTVKDHDKKDTSHNYSLDPNTIPAIPALLPLRIAAANSSARRRR